MEVVFGGVRWGQVDWHRCTLTCVFTISGCEIILMEFVLYSGLEGFAFDGRGDSVNILQLK